MLGYLTTQSGHAIRAAQIPYSDSMPTAALVDVLYGSVHNGHMASWGLPVTHLFLSDKYLLALPHGFVVHVAIFVANGVPDVDDETLTEFFDRVWHRYKTSRSAFGFVERFRTIFNAAREDSRDDTVVVAHFNALGMAQTAEMANLIAGVTVSPHLVADTDALPRPPVSGVTGRWIVRGVTFNNFDAARFFVSMLGYNTWPGAKLREDDLLAVAVTPVVGGVHHLYTGSSMAYVASQVPPWRPGAILQLEAPPKLRTELPVAVPGQRASSAGDVFLIAVHLTRENAADPRGGGIITSPTLAPEVATRMYHAAVANIMYAPPPRLLMVDKAAECYLAFGTVERTFFDTPATARRVTRTTPARTHGIAPPTATSTSATRQRQWGDFVMRPDKVRRTHSAFASDDSARRHGAVQTRLSFLAPSRPPPPSPPRLDSDDVEEEHSAMDIDDA